MGNNYDGTLEQSAFFKGFDAGWHMRHFSSGTYNRAFYGQWKQDAWAVYKGKPVQLELSLETSAPTVRNVAAQTVND